MVVHWHFYLTTLQLLSMVWRTAVSASPGSLLEMQSLRLHLDGLNQSQQVNKIPKWSVCIFEKFKISTSFPFSAIWKKFEKYSKQWELNGRFQGKEEILWLEKGLFVKMCRRFLCRSLWQWSQIDSTIALPLFSCVHQTLLVLSSHSLNPQLHGHWCGNQHCTSIIWQWLTPHWPR